MNTTVGETSAEIDAANTLSRQCDRRQYGAIVSELQEELRMYKTAVITVGAQGAGKSTITKELTEGTDAVVVASADHHMVDGKGVYGFKPEKCGHCHRECRRCFNQGIADGIRSVFCDNTNVVPKHMKPYVEVACNAGYRVVILNFFVPSDVSVQQATHALGVRNEHKVPEAKIAEAIATQCANAKAMATLVAGENAKIIDVPIQFRCEELRTADAHLENTPDASASVGMTITPHDRVLVMEFKDLGWMQKWMARADDISSITGPDRPQHVGITFAYKKTTPKAMMFKFAQVLKGTRVNVRLGDVVTDINDCGMVRFAPVMEMTPIGDVSDDARAIIAEFLENEPQHLTLATRGRPPYDCHAVHRRTEVQRALRGEP
jgi:predicted ABC-type ATPase